MRLPQKISDLRIAVAGATGAVGGTMLELLHERGHRPAKVVALASERSIGSEVQFGRQTLPVDSLAEFDFGNADIALFSAGSRMSQQYAPVARDAGCSVIDNSSAFRNDAAIPLVIPEINGSVLDGLAHPGIIANPNCSTIQMLMALAPVHREVGIRRIVVSTYQSVSGAGRSAQEALARQTAAKLTFQQADADQASQPIAFNVIPLIDDLQENGYSREEMKMLWETQKILDDLEISVNATAVRVPVFFGHGSSIQFETRQDATPEAIESWLSKTPGVVWSPPQSPRPPTPVTDAAGSDNVFVGRFRKDLAEPNTFSCWVVSDNLRKGAALNAVQILEYLVNAE